MFSWEDIINPGNMNSPSETVGSKTLKLRDLQDLGLNVPKFMAISAEETVKMIDRKGSVDTLVIKIRANEIADLMQCERYAVRSSALTEDSLKESLAGQFKTIINVERENLANSIEVLITHACEFLGGQIEKFSIIIQEYIDADFAGVTFTRNPLSDREIVVEYHNGKGEDVVSGKIKPEKFFSFWNSPAKEFLPGGGAAFENFKKIETHYGWPQDIEWCIKNSEWYFLQTRPITTLSEQEYKQFLYLDEVLPNDKKFYFAKTEISEIAPRPAQFTMSLLDKIYAEDGPIKKVYQKYNVTYEPRPIFEILGNELFVDKEQELKSLLPIYSYLKSSDFQPTLDGFSGFFRTIKNLFHIRKISPRGEKEFLKNLKSSLIENLPGEFKTALEFFLEKYETVFKINLLASAATKNLEVAIKKEKVDLPSLLAFGHKIVKENLDLELKIDLENISGNSLDVADESAFTISQKSEKENAELKKWWAKVPEWKRPFFEDKIKNAVNFNRLREIARWVVVRHINNLRNILFKIAQDKKFSEKRNMYFAEIAELMSMEFAESELIKRSEGFMKYMSFTLPRELVYKHVENDTSLQGVSPGIAEGILVTENEMNESEYDGKKKILYTKILSPDLTKYFDQIAGIISEQGGMLSHLSIMARERGIPVVVGFKGRIEIGKLIKIDGGKGEIS